MSRVQYMRRKGGIGENRMEREKETAQSALTLEYVSVDSGFQQYIG